MAANRTKTVEYVLPSILTNVAQSTTHTDTADQTIYIPETTSRAFKSVFIEVVCGDNGGTVQTLSAWSVRGSCNSGSNFTTNTQAAAYANTGENQTHCFFTDMTAEFTARFGTGATGTFRYGIYLSYAGAINFTNVTAKIYITYEYDDTAHATRVKTVRIPIESFNGRLSNTAQIIRQGTITDQVPALDTFLPEASIVYRQITAELWTNTLPSATTATAIYIKLDSGGAETTYGTLGTLTSPVWLRLFFDMTAMTTSGSHDLYARHNVAAGSYCAHIGGWVIVTYEYNHTNSNSGIMNSLIVGFAEGSTNVRTSTDAEKYTIERRIEEPGTIALKQSGIFLTYSTGSTNSTLSFGVGSQTVTGYTPTAGSTMAGMGSLMHRVDAGGYRGAGFSLVRGVNTFTTQWYAANADYISNVSCTMILNYTSDKHANGDGAHAHSVHYGIAPNNRNTLLYLSTSATVTPNIIEPEYYLLAVMPVIYGNGVSGAAQYYVVQVEINNGEYTDAGWVDLFSSIGIQGNERQFQISNGACRFAFKRWIADTDTTRLDIESPRTWRISGVTAQWGIGLWITYNSISYTISGTVKGYTGDGSGITVFIYRIDTHEKIGEVTTSAGGAYTFTWYDNVTNVYSTAIQDDTHAGRSRDGTAV